MPLRIEAPGRMIQLGSVLRPIHMEVSMSRSLAGRFGPLSLVAIVLAAWLVAPPGAESQQPDPLAEPFEGITTDGNLVTNLFPVRATGVSTGPIVEAARHYLSTLSPGQLAQTRFDLDDKEWRHWSNVPVGNTPRAGLSFRDMNEAQQEAAFAMVRSGLSARGFNLARDIMRIDGYLADVLDDLEGYGEYLYFIDIFGEPSETEPWGWQLDGHHLVVNFFVMGDQVVMSPNFWGSEPVRVPEGRYAGVAVLQEEQDIGVRFMESLRADQRRMATVETDKTQNNQLAAAFRDNVLVEEAGIRGDQLDATQRELLMDVIGVWVGHMREEHAGVQMQEMRARLDETRFAWVGDVGEDALYYYRVQSPVFIIEFDHSVPVSFPVEPRMPSRTHIHAGVRTPNGNDYGKDLLRQHYEQHANDPGHGHDHPHEAGSARAGGQ